MELAIGKQLKAVRQERNLTLEEASVITGVSKPMLGQIERGQSVPTIHTLWKIATGLKIPLSLLLQEQTLAYTIVSCGEEKRISEENGAMRAYPIFPYDPIRSFETFYLEFDPGCRHRSDRHNKNVEETVFILSGKLDLIIKEEKITLTERQAIRFSADVAHSYQNPYEKICCVYNTIFY